jgi:hypothetical protein
VIVTKKAVPSSSKKKAIVLLKTQMKSRPTLKKQQGQVDQDGEVIESTSVTYVGTDVIGMYISQYKDIMSNI